MNEEKETKTAKEDVTGADGALGTPYDDVFRTLYTDSDMLAIALINEMFDKNIDLHARLRRFQNEHYIAGDVKRVSDSNAAADDGIIYHLECESTGGDSRILIRLFEYRSGIALEHAVIEGDTLYVELPLTGVLYLRSTDNTPDDMRMVITSPDSVDTLSTEIRFMKLNSYSLDDIFEKKLYFLLPFYVFEYEAEVKRAYGTKDNGQALIRQVREELAENIAQILKKLEKLEKASEIDTFTRLLIHDMLRKVTESLYHRYDEIKEGVEEIMGGKVLDYEAKRIYNRGMEQGIRKSIKDMLLNGRTISDIVEFCGYPEELVNEVNDEIFNELP